MLKSWFLDTLGPQMGTQRSFRRWWWGVHVYTSLCVRACVHLDLGNSCTRVNVQVEAGGKLQAWLSRRDLPCLCETGLLGEMWVGLLV